MKIVDQADFTYRNLESDDSISIASIAAWYRNNIGQLNSLIGKDYTLNSSLEIVDSAGVEIGVEEFAIFDKMYNIAFLSRKIRTSLGAGSLDPVTQVSSDGGSVTLGVNRNALSITYLNFRKEVSAELKTLLNNYKFNGSRSSQIVGDDIIGRRYGIYGPRDVRC